MIKKPKSPTLADYVRGNEEIINQKWQEIKDYKKEVFDVIAKELETDDAYELVIRLAEKYYEPFKINEKQGRKKKWTPQIEVMLAVLVELRKDDEKPSSVMDEIDWLLSLQSWNDFAQRGNKKDVDGLEMFRKAYESGRKNSLFQYEMDSYKENPKKWLAKLVQELK
jgi:hypothetical protein